MIIENPCSPCLVILKSNRKLTKLISISEYCFLHFSQKSAKSNFLNKFFKCYLQISFVANILAELCVMTVEKQMYIRFQKNEIYFLIISK